MYLPDQRIFVPRYPSRKMKIGFIILLIAICFASVHAEVRGIWVNPSPASCFYLFLSETGSFYTNSGVRS